MAQLKVEIKALGDFTILSLEGEFFVSTLGEVKRIIQEEFNNHHYFLAFDLSRLTQIDSSALGLIYNIKKKVDEKSGHFALYSVPQQVLNNLSDIGILGNIVIVKNEEEFKDNFIL